MREADNKHKSSSHVQLQAEDIIFAKIEKLLDVVPQAISSSGMKLDVAWKESMKVKIAQNHYFIILF